MAPSDNDSGVDMAYDPDQDREEQRHVRQQYRHLTGR